MVVSDKIPYIYIIGLAINIAIRSKILVDNGKCKKVYKYNKIYVQLSKSTSNRPLPLKEVKILLKGLYQ